RSAAPSPTVTTAAEAAAHAGDITARTQDAEAAAGPAKERNVGVGGLILIGAGLLLALFFLPDLRRDVSLQDAFRADYNVAIERANGRRYLFLVTHCSVHFSWQDGGGRRTASSNFLVGLKSMGGVHTFPVRSGVDASVVTTSVALESLGNRIGTLALSCGL